MTDWTDFAAERAETRWCGSLFWPTLSSCRCQVFGNRPRVLPWLNRIATVADGAATGGVLGDVALLIPSEDFTVARGKHAVGHVSGGGVLVRVLTGAEGPVEVTDARPCTGQLARPGLT